MHLVENEGIVHHKARVCQGLGSFYHFTCSCVYQSNTSRELCILVQKLTVYVGHNLSKMLGDRVDYEQEQFEVFKLQVL